MIDGLVIKTAGAVCTVAADDGRTIDTCRIKGNFRLRGIRTTNPVAVGDRVGLELQDDGTAWVTCIAPRRNYIIRRASNLSRESQVMAANIDLAALMVTISHPRTLITFVDRFLTTAEAYGIPACLLFNKTDLYDAADMEQLAQWRSIYEPMGYACHALVATDPASVGELARLFAGQTVMLAGNSGVGKSTLLNALIGSEVARTADLSEAHDQGMHTTTFSQMYQMPYGGWLIDSPGIRGFGIIDMQPAEIGRYFRDIGHYARQCRFSDCLHQGEPGCAVVPACEEGLIAPSRLESYYGMLDDCDQQKYR